MRLTLNLILKTRPFISFNLRNFPSNCSHFNNLNSTMNIEDILIIQALFLGGIALGNRSFKIDSQLMFRYGIKVARFIACLLISNALEWACTTVYTAMKSKKFPEVKFKDRYKLSLYVLASSVVFVVYNSEPFLLEETVMLMMACAAVRYLESKRQLATISYGEGMACSYVEGYLYQVIPSDGGENPGLEELIRNREASDRVPFPVRRLLIVITKSLHCPPNMEAFNKPNENAPKIELSKALSSMEMWFVLSVPPLAQSLGDVRRSVAGVRDRVFRSCTYRVQRRARDPRPVSVAAECATPLHTLWRVLQRRAVYRRLATADVEEICSSFCSTLVQIIAGSPELRGRCELVYYDDTNPNENLAEVLLAKIRELEPNFENMSID